MLDVDRTLCPTATVRPSNMKARVLHVINGEHYSGAERVQDLLAGTLPGLGYPLGFACVKPDMFPGKRKNKSAPIHDVGMKNRFDLFAVNRVSQLIREHDYRIVHAHTPRSALVGGAAARKCGLPFVFHVHSPTARDSTRWLLNRINQKVENWSIRRAEKIVTVSDSLRQYMTDLGFDSGKIVVVPNGVPTQPDSRYAKPSLPFIIGTVALFRPRKGTEILLEAVARLRKLNIPVKILAVGPFETPEYESHLKCLAADLQISDAIHWTGFVEDIQPWFSQMHTFVLPSLFGEGLPMVVLEAMSFRVPVVAADVEGIPQAVRHQKDGLIVKPGDPDDLADKLGQLANDRTLCESLSESGYRRQRDHFSDRSMAQNLAAVYDKILS